MHIKTLHRTEKTCLRCTVDHQKFTGYLVWFCQRPSIMIMKELYFDNSIIKLFLRLISFLATKKCWNGKKNVLYTRLFSLRVFSPFYNCKRISTYIVYISRPFLWLVCLLSVCSSVYIFSNWSSRYYDLGSYTFWHQ